MKSTGTEYAIKIVDKGHVTRYNKVDEMLNERKVLSMLDHPNIIKLHFTFQDEYSLCMLPFFMFCCSCCSCSCSCCCSCFSLSSAFQHWEITIWAENSDYVIELAPKGELFHLIHMVDFNLFRHMLCSCFEMNCFKCVIC